MLHPDLSKRIARIATWSTAGAGVGPWTLSSGQSKWEIGSNNRVLSGRRIRSTLLGRYRSSVVLPLHPNTTPSVWLIGPGNPAGIPVPLLEYYPFGVIRRLQRAGSRQ